MVKIGVDYYPEHWEKTEWEKDIALMKETGVSVVRIGEFAWSVLEPSDGNFDFSLFDEIISKFSAADIQIILGTPTNCAPLWLYRKFPETLQVERDGKITETGIRGHRCMTNPVFRKYAERIISELAERYGKNPAVIGWQIDNELNSNHCCCKYCAEGFRIYLKNKFRNNIQALNTAYGNDVWSGNFSDFEDITPPLGKEYKYGWLNPSYMLDYERYASESTLDFIKFQTDIIRKFCPDKIITTNACFSENTPDFYKIFKNLDVAAYDNYPCLYRKTENYNPEQAFILDMTRGYKKENFWITEQMSGGFGCWWYMSPTPLPGMIKGYAMQAVARGANLITNFRFKTSVKGAEMFCHGLIDHSGVPGRRFEEFSSLCAEIVKLKIPENTVIKSKVAILYSYEQEYAFKIQTMSEGFSYSLMLHAFHRQLVKAGINIDVIEETSDISGYKLVIIPSYFVTDEKVSENLKTFARNGGTVIMTCLSGIKNNGNACIREIMPCGLTDLTGVTVEEYDAEGNNTVTVKRTDGKEYICKCWCDILKTTTAETLANYSNNFYKGSPAVTLNKYGKGYCYYAGTIGGEDFYNDLVSEALKLSDIEYNDLPNNFEITERENDDEIFTFIFNNSNKVRKLNYKEKLYNFNKFEVKVIHKYKGT